jgi:hypothetical protein
MAKNESTNGREDEGKRLRPSDRRLKANRDFENFMQAAVYAPQRRGDFKNDPTVCPQDLQRERIVSARRIEDYTDGDLAWLLRGAMLKEGVEPFSQADNILAHLRERLERRERDA